VLALAGGTGITFTLPIVSQTLRQQTGPRFAIALVWVVRHARDLLWLREELAELKAQLKEAANLRVKIFVSRENRPPNTMSEKTAVLATSSTSSVNLDLEDVLNSTSNYTVEFLGERHPSVADVVCDFAARRLLVVVPSRWARI
jgi:NAD(P)H-flavin reductase